MLSKASAQYGVVASLTAGKGTKSIGLRADTDALPIQEDNNLPYKSAVAGVAHLCGHDGHTAMLLAAGEYLARSRNFHGTVRLNLQPAEEIMAGGPAMIEDGLLSAGQSTRCSACTTCRGSSWGNCTFGTAR